MTIPTTFIHEGVAWVSESSLHKVLDGTAEPHTFSFFSFDASRMGYVNAGTARVEVQIHNVDTLRQCTAESIRAQIDKVRAESQNQITELTRKLNEVLAIDFTPEIVE
jgi:hypothetical protein